MEFGSSPRGRGTPLLFRVRSADWRFIPAWAGNTGSGLLKVLAMPVHPRVGGEHVYPARHHGPAIGSSPRGRGTHFASVSRHFRARFIPAWAGNTMWLRHRRRRRPVHPRVGGEHSSACRKRSGSTGSSPRGRGTPGVAGRRSREFRFIPAWAGNTSPALQAAGNRAVHPRVGGEHPASMLPEPTLYGSSPRGRGTPAAARCGRISERFIPEWAGNTIGR